MTTLLASLKSLFKPRQVKVTGAKLYAACVAQARLPVFYLDYDIEDAIGARFELLALHVIMAVTRLKAVPADDRRQEQALDTSQSLFDSFLLALDSALREQGTGDLTVPKKMKRLGVVIYSRMKRWDDMWRDGAPLAEQAGYASRTIFAGSAYAGDDDNDDDTAVAADVADRAAVFAGYVAAARASLDVDSLLRGDIVWPQPPGFETAALETTPDSVDSSTVDAVAVEA